MGGGWIAVGGRVVGWMEVHVRGKHHLNLQLVPLSPSVPDNHTVLLGAFLKTSRRPLTTGMPSPLLTTSGIPVTLQSVPRVLTPHPASSRTWDNDMAVIYLYLFLSLQRPYIGTLLILKTAANRRRIGGFLAWALGTDSPHRSRERGCAVRHRGADVKGRVCLSHPFQWGPNPSSWLVWDVEEEWVRHTDRCLPRCNQLM